MGFSSLARHEVTRLRAPLAEGDYGGKKRHDWDDVDNIDQEKIDGCLLQPVSSSESFEATVAQLESKWRLFAPSGADIAAADRIEGRGLTFEVDGPVMPRTSLSGRLDHVEILLTRRGES